MPGRIRGQHWSGFNLPGRALGEVEAHGYARACWPSGSEAELRFLTLQIAVMTALDDAFDTAGVTDPQRLPPLACLNLFPWRRRGHLDVGLTWRPLSEALAYLDVRITRLAPGTPDRRQAVRAWWRQQAEHQVAAFDQETRWRIEGSVPDLATYLPVAQRSIGVEWTAASLIALDPQAPVPAPGSPLRAAVESIARAIRLANDLHDPERERREGKVQWLLLRASQLMAVEAERAAAEERARTELRRAVTAEAARAHTMLSNPARARLAGSPRLHAGLRGLLGVGLAVYAPDLAPAA
ncbi:MAG TPA: hypothetical protein VF937_08095 [Chloroflexota bacterium]